MSKTTSVLGFLATFCVAADLFAQGAPAPSKAERVPDLIKPGDRLFIHVTNTLPDLPIRGVFRVEPSGKVALGAAYQRVVLAGMTLEGAEGEIRKVMATFVREPSVMVIRHDPIGQTQESEPALERRLRQVEEQVRALQAEVEKLRRKTSRQR